MISATPDGRAELWEQLTRAIELRSSQDQVLWTIFGFFGATNAVLLAALFASGGLPDDSATLAVVVVAGLALSWLWHSIQGRALGHIARHEDLMERIERALQVPPDLAISARINTAAYEAFLSGGVPARKTMSRCGLGSALFWVAILLVYLAKECV